MFLWVSLVIEDLSGTPIQDVRSKLMGIPTDLYQLYRNLLDSLSHEVANVAKEILMWVICAPEPMTVQQLAWACAMKSNQNSRLAADRSFIHGCKRNIELCGPILKLDDEYDRLSVHPHGRSTFVKLCHQSAYV
jgi:hypothetical protein